MLFSIHLQQMDFKRKYVYVSISIASLLFSAALFYLNHKKDAKLAYLECRVSCMDLTIDNLKEALAKEHELATRYEKLLIEIQESTDEHEAMMKAEDDLQFYELLIREVLEPPDYDIREYRLEAVFFISKQRNVYRQEHWI